MTPASTMPLDALAAACRPLAENAATVIDHLVGGRWNDAALLARDAVLACGDGAISALQGLLPALGL